jgi:predicted flavoprotein YhiN
MNVSHLAARHPGKNLRLVMDFCAPFEAELTVDALTRAKGTSPSGFLHRFFPPKASRFFLEYAGLRADEQDLPLEVQAMQGVLASLRAVSLPIVGVRSFDESQLSAGGVPVTEVSPESCESLRVPGLYLVGETLDVVGPCGGYNLHFAFTSGTLAGLHLASQPASL